MDRNWFPENFLTKHHSLPLQGIYYERVTCFYHNTGTSNRQHQSLWGCKNMSLLCLDSSLYAWFVKRSCCWCKIRSMSKIGSCSCVNWLLCVHNSRTESTLLRMREFSLAIVSASPNCGTEPPPGSCHRSSSSCSLIAFSAWYSNQVQRNVSSPVEVGV